MIFLNLFKKRKTPTLKHIVLFNDVDLKNQLSRLNSDDIVAIMPYKFEFKDMRDSQLLSAILIILKENK